MKKSSLLLCLSLLVCITGCSSNQEFKSNYKSRDSSVSENTFVLKQDYRSVSVNDTNNYVIFTQDKADSIKDYLSEYTFINFTQTIQNGLKDEAPINDITYTVIADTSTNICQLSLNKIINGDLSNETSISDLSTGETYVQDIDGYWQRADGIVQMINWNLTEYENTYDLYKYLVDNIDLQIGTFGVLIDEGRESYQFTSVAKEGSLSGVDYDELCNQTVTFIVDKIGDSYRPSKISIDIEYIVDDVTYYCRSDIQIIVVNNTKLLMPKLE